MNRRNEIFTWAAAFGVAAVLVSGALLDGPSVDDIARMEAADLVDARSAAQRFDRDLRACKLAMGPSADLVQIAGTDDYVCREMPIEPTPAVILHRYADLSGRKL